MPKETERTNVAIPKDVHTAHAQIARTLGIEIRDATTEAVRDWNRRKAPAAKKRAAETLATAA